MTSLVGGSPYGAWYAAYGSNLARARFQAYLSPTWPPRRCVGSRAVTDLGRVLRDGRHSYGPGRYKTLHMVGEVDEAPVLTFTAPVHGLVPNAPTAPYLDTIVRGLRECHGLSEAAIEVYVRAATHHPGRRFMPTGTVRAAPAAGQRLRSGPAEESHLGRRCQEQERPCRGGQLTCVPRTRC